MEEIHPRIPRGSEREQTVAVLLGILSNTSCTHGELEGTGSLRAHGYSRSLCSRGWAHRHLGTKTFVGWGSFLGTGKIFVFFYIYFFYVGRMTEEFYNCFI